VDPGEEKGEKGRKSEWVRLCGGSCLPHRENFEMPSGHVPAMAMNIVIAVRALRVWYKEILARRSVTQENKL
jgi:hypothetical protein